MFPVVFFIDMQLAKPDDTIESRSISKEQCGLSQPVELERLKSKCLVVIDGFNDFSTHTHVLNRIRPGMSWSWSTRLHSSRLCTVRSSGHLLGGV